MGPIDRCCGLACTWGTPEEPCWGDVVVVDEEALGDDDWFWVHACEGHVDRHIGLSYIYPPPGCDTIRADDEEQLQIERKTNNT